MKNIGIIASHNPLVPEDLLQQIDEQGWCIVENAVPPELVAMLKHDLIKAIELEAQYHKSRDYPDFGMVLFCPLYGKSFTELIECASYLAPVEALMGDACIIYSYTSSSMPPSKGNYSSQIHNDCPFTIPTDYITRCQILLALDDFTPENGATYVLPGSHKLAKPPSEEEFYTKAVRLTMKAGTAWYAHAKIWHAGGVNSTDQWRHAVTTVFCRPYMKQRIDIPRLLSNQNQCTMSKRALQKFGFFAQVPTSYDEYYVPLEQRKFTQAME